MRIAVIGSGYAGTTLAAGLANVGHEVTAVDIDADVVAAINEGTAPIYEPGLDELIAETAGDRLVATTEYGEITDASLIFVAVQTPSRADGSIDIGPLRGATLDAVDTLLAGSDRDDGHVLVIKSTVTPPHLTALREEIRDRTDGREVSIDLAANPEFLREGTAVQDFQRPDKVVFGVDSDVAAERLERVFAPIIDRVDPAVISTDPETAAMIKYANNAFLAAKISLINDLGNVCKEFGVDAYEVAEAIGTDDRIEESFLRSGVGWGGSCFPKDVSAIVSAARDVGYEPAMLEAAQRVNARQPTRLVELLEAHLDPRAKRVAVLGLSFKPGTDDIRNSRAIPVIETLLDRGAEVVGYDPVAIEEMRDRFPNIEYADSAAAALSGASAAVVVTDWDEFAALDEEFDAMERPIVVDGRRIISRREGLTYEGLTW